MLVTPDNEVHAVIEHAFRNRLLGTMSHTAEQRENDVYEKMVEQSSMLAFVIPILVKEQYIEPFVLVSRHVHADSVAPKLEMHALVLDVAYAIQAKESAALAEENRSNRDAGLLRVSV